MISCVPDSEGGWKAGYKGPGEEELYARTLSLVEHLERLLSIRGLTFQNCTVDIDEKLIGDLLVRVDKRFDYYRIFHKDTYLSEVREAAIEAYWILKYKPIRMIECKLYEGESFDHINESFALFLVFSVIAERRRRLGQPDFAVNQACLNQLIYAMRHWDLSKEALMLIAVALESITVKEPAGSSAPFEGGLD